MAPTAPIVISTISIPSPFPMRLGDLESHQQIVSIFHAARWLQASLLRSLCLSGARRQLCKRLLFSQPRLIFALLVNDDLATHGIVCRTAQLSAEQLERSGSGGNEPDVGDHARHQIH